MVNAFARRGRAFGLLCGAAAAALLSAANPPPAHAQGANYLELRLAGSRAGSYRYAEFTRQFCGAVVADIIYSGVPGQNELYFGVGRLLRPTRHLSVTPLIYGVVGKENRQRGISLASFVSGTARGWSVYSFLSYFHPVDGAVPRYLSLDSLDISRVVRQPWELGGSAGLVHVGGTWTTLAGPIVIRNDALGTWRFYLRGGSNLEIRLGRTFTF